jgi:mannan endo-1,4-beta-mannosidase
VSGRRRERRLTRTLYATMAVAAVVVLAFAYSHPVHHTVRVATSVAQGGVGAPIANAPANGTVAAHGNSGSGGSRVVAATAPAAAYNVAPLIDPVGKKYLGVAVADAPTSMANYSSFVRASGTKPSIITEYLAFGYPFDSVGAANAYDAGAMLMVQWEPVGHSLTDIAAGDDDSYITTFAKTVRSVNLPVVISFGHEMNGGWYSWGSSDNSAASFVAAWRHIHDLFAKAGATNVIWLWDANVTYTDPDVPLEPLYPGDSYVDWVGLTGYYHQDTSGGGRITFDTLFTPSAQQIRTFTKKPLLIAETAAAPGPLKAPEIRDLFTTITEHDDLIGAVWFNYDKSGENETDWTFNSDPAAAAEFGRVAGQAPFDITIH